MIEYHITKGGICESLDKVPPGAVVDAIDGKGVIPICASCGKYIVIDDDYAEDIEGVTFCRKCFDTILKEEQNGC